MPPKPRRTNNKKKKGSKNSSSSNHATVAAAAAADPPARPSALPFRVHGDALGCLHGAPDWNFEDPRLKGVKTIWESFDRNPNDPGVVPALMMANECPECNNEYSVQALVSLGTAFILSEGEGVSGAGTCAHAILTLEKVRVDSSAKKVTPDQYAQLLVNLDSPRNIVKFFRKRIPCNCLDDKWEALKYERTGK